jgi:hypothetical protein
MIDTLHFYLLHQGEYYSYIVVTRAIWMRDSESFTYPKVAQCVTQQMSPLCSSPSHTLSDTFLSIVSTAAVILNFSASISSGRRGTNSCSFTYPHRKRSHGARTGDRGGHFIQSSFAAATLSIQRFRSVAFRNLDHSGANEQALRLIKRWTCSAPRSDPMWPLSVGICPRLPLDIDELKFRITAAVETIDRNMLEYGMSWITDWTFVGSRMELTLTVFRVGKTSRVCHSNGASYTCIAVVCTLL